ncbi:MAG: DUF433 domain-containing protein [Chroococcidiopsidaceae cyanobacterium CP_BM_ER_R8_30]|nr:DUF433 domain-containing protein [Chroococcidiopsidaceae cyanobacterium CP_BM_ER_R8_30]
MVALSTKPYVEQRDGGYWIVGTRISLDSVVYAFLKGKSPESIMQSFPLLTLEQIYGAITFYLANRPLIDDYLVKADAEFSQLQQLLEATNPLLYRKLRTATERSVSNY